jgi:hypothetical protein
MSICKRETCVFLTNSSYEYCCSGCQANGVHGIACEGIEQSKLGKLFATDNNLPGPGFDLGRCNGAVNQDGSVSITIAWSTVSGSTTYKILKGGNSPIVLNAMFLNTFLDQSGCFESGPKHLTLQVDEYLTTNTSYSLTIPAATISARRAAQSTSTNCRFNLSFSVYSYNGNLRGPVPYGVLLVDVIFPTVVTTPASGQPQQGKIVAQIRPNITVSLVPTVVGDLTTVGLIKYQFTNHYDDTKKTVTITLGSNGLPTPDYINNNSIQDVGAIETKVLYNVI